MKLKKILLFILPVLAGLGTARLRYVAIENAVDPGTGIPNSTGWLTAAYGVMIAVLALILVYTLFTGKRCAPDEGLQKGVIYKTLCVAAGLLFLVSGGAAFFSLAQDGASVLVLLKALFALLCGAAVVGGLKAGNGEAGGLCSLMPVFYAAYTLLTFYRSNNANPLIYSFATELFAFIFAMFCLYAAAAFRFQKPRPRMLQFSALAGIYLLVTVLCSDNLLPFFTKGHLHFDVADLLTMGAFLLLLGAHLWVMEPRRGAREAKAEK